jgi:hypothetical protein
MLYMTTNTSGVMRVKRDIFHVRVQAVTDGAVAETETSYYAGELSAINKN